MTHQIKRCRHCKIVYHFQGSGHGCDDPFNDEIFCPDCMKIYLQAFKGVPIKRKQEMLPIIKGTTDVTITQFENELSKNPFASMIVRLTGYKNLKVQGYSIDGVHYELNTKTDTNEKMLTAEYEIDIENEKVLGLWTKY